MADQANPSAGNPPRPGEPVPQGGLDPSQVFGTPPPPPQAAQGAQGDDAVVPATQDASPPPPPPGQAATKEMGYDDEDLKILAEVGNYRFGSIANTLTNENVIVPAHTDVNVDEQHFLTLLRGSVSLTKDEKWRIIQALPKLSQYQVDELQKILEEERLKFSELSPKHLKQLMILENKHAEEWKDLQSISKQEQVKSNEQAQADEIRKQLGL